MPPRLAPPMCSAQLLRRSLAEGPACSLRLSRASSPASIASTASTAPLHTTARMAAAVTVGPGGRLVLPADYVPPTQPPSAKRPDIRKSQLLRSYTSLLRSTPLMLVFQHGNLTGPEWTAVRRELALALDRAAEQQALDGIAWPVDLAASIRLQVIRTRIFDVALRLTEFYEPEPQTSQTSQNPHTYTHDLSAAAYAAVQQARSDGVTAADRSVYGQLAPLMTGPLAVLTFPAVSPAHLAAALSVLAPVSPAFPAPGRKKNPGYYEPVVQAALPKLLLLGGRVEGRAFDADGVRWVGAINGGRTGLQAQLVALLQAAGLGLTTALEGAGKNLWLTMESRRTMLEEDGRPTRPGRPAHPPSDPAVFCARWSADDSTNLLYIYTLLHTMDFAPYQSSSPENERTFSPPAPSPRTSLERPRFSPRQQNNASPAAKTTSTASPPPLQHPQPQRQWAGGMPSPTYYSYQQGASGGISDGDDGRRRGSLDPYDGRDNVISEFDTSLGLRLDYEACLAYLALPPVGSILLLILERKSDYVRFHAWQASLVFTAFFVLHLLFSWSTVLSWLIFLADLGLMAWLTYNAYRDADTLDRFEVPFFGRIANKIVDDE
ncbi:upf0132 domain containing protein [Grosmannia clavigera kw1407]|uniref:Upf0132 domain containing protein n=1 Tax=Grosmannia clavigera (strain kw1407 / UAMH 11150) TaxID=655863 RepID=F0XP94_GROCL|nr:upf0132 domain containing protein [Grosmannia clavigera kw1407]EFX00267.1 upf0132 domain containing protein [Grosmannia clavigera kw1407]